MCYHSYGFHNVSTQSPIPSPGTYIVSSSMYVQLCVGVNIKTLYAWMTAVHKCLHSLFTCSFQAVSKFGKWTQYTATTNVK